MKKKIYISGKITGLKHKEACKNFDESERFIKLLRHIPVNPMKLDHYHGKTWEEYMKEDLISLLKCDGIFMQKNWEGSKGAIIEHQLAKNLGMKIIYEKKIL